MKTLVSVMVVMLVVGLVVPAQGGDNVQARKMYYESAITQEIAEIVGGAAAV